jgi:hypothetical protein
MGRSRPLPTVVGVPRMSTARDSRSRTGWALDGFSVNTVGIILMVGGLLGLLLSALFLSSFSPWSRRRTVAGGDRVVEERRIEREF